MLAVVKLFLRREQEVEGMPDQAMGVSIDAWLESARRRVRQQYTEIQAAIEHIPTPAEYRPAWFALEALRKREEALVKRFSFLSRSEAPATRDAGADLDFLATRRNRRFALGRESFEYVPIAILTREDRSPVPIVRDEIVIPPVEFDDPRVRRLLTDVDRVDDAHVDTAVRIRSEDAAPAQDFVRWGSGTPSYVAVACGRLKNPPLRTESASAPQPVSGVAPEEAPPVVVVDTGIAAGMVAGYGGSTEERTDTWLNRFRLADDHPAHVDPLDVLEPPGLDIGAGHGSFVAGVVGQVTSTHIIMIRALDSDGIGGDRAVATAILQAARIFSEAGGRGVLNLSFGIETGDDTEPAIVRRALERLPNDVVVVAAAGSSPTGRPVWPAASTRAVGVAAVDYDGQPAGWSNYGSWIDFSARGVEVVAPYVTGTGTTGTGRPGDPFDTEPDTYFGPNPFAVWEGTSFATAQVSGAIANLLWEEPTRPATAAVEALRSGSNAIPNYGYVADIL